MSALRLLVCCDSLLVVIALMCRLQKALPDRVTLPFALGGHRCATSGSRLTSDPVAMATCPTPLRPRCEDDSTCASGVRFAVHACAMLITLCHSIFFFFFAFLQEFDIDPDADSEHVDDLLALCVKQATQQQAPSTDGNDN